LHSPVFIFSDPFCYVVTRHIYGLR